MSAAACLALADRTHREHNRRAVGCERAGCFEAEPGVRPGDHRCPTPERRDVGGRPPFRSHAATERLPGLSPVLGVPVTAALRAVLRRRRELSRPARRRPRRRRSCLRPLRTARRGALVRARRRSFGRQLPGFDGVRSVGVSRRERVAGTLQYRRGFGIVFRNHGGDATTTVPSMTRFPIQRRASIALAKDWSASSRSPWRSSRSPRTPHAVVRCPPASKTASRASTIARSRSEFPRANAASERAF